MYRIVEWDDIYENNRTRGLKEMRWVPVPNKMDGDGYTVLVDHKDAAAHLGAWLAILHVASRCHPRGTLVRANGQAHDSATLSRQTRLPAKLFDDVLTRLCGDEIQWVEKLTDKEIKAVKQLGAVRRQEGAGGAQGTDYGMEGNGKERNIYGQLGCVSLNDKEYALFLDEQGADRLKLAIEKIDGYLNGTTRKYKSHAGLFKADGWVWDAIDGKDIGTGNGKGKKLDPMKVFDRALAEITIAYEHEEDKARFWKSSKDKYRDIPKLKQKRSGKMVHVVDYAKKHIKERAA